MRVLSLLAVIGAAVLSGCGDEAAAPPPAAPEVGVVTLAASTVSDVRNLPGRTSAFVIAEVRPQVTGIIAKRLFEEGSEVKAGQPLYQLDDAIYRAEVASRRAALAKTQAALEAARLTAKRTTELARIDAVSTQEAETATAGLQQSEADVASAEAALRSAEVNLSYARITSPISGRTGKSNFTQGALVTANQDAPLTTVQQLDPMYVDLQQSSSELLRLREDFGSDLNQSAPVLIELENGSRYKHSGELKFAGVSVDPQTGSFGLRAVVPNPDRILLPGMFVRAVLERGTRPDAVLAPQRAITRDPKGNGMAFIVNAENKVEQRTVSTVRTIGDQWLIEKGLQAGERVVVEGVQKIQPGMTVSPIEAGVAQAGAGQPGAGQPSAAGQQRTADAAAR